MTMPTTVTHRTLKASLRDLPGYPALREAVAAHVDAIFPKPAREQGGKNIFHAVLVAAARERVKVRVWGMAALILAEGDDAAFDGITVPGFPAVRAAALAMREESEEAVAIAAAALSALESAIIGTFPAINDEAF
jgi:hypothetical protein